MTPFSICREEYLAKIEKRVKEYKIDIISEPRPDKKLLVLDIDYTLFGKRIKILFGATHSYRIAIFPTFPDFLIV